METILAVALLAASSTLALAQAEKADPGSLSGEAKEEPSAAATSSGSTAAPSAKPADSSLSDKAMKDNPGTSAGGSTAQPNAQPKSSDLPAGAKDDMDKK
jgi:hypothetical protein